ALGSRFVASLEASHLPCLVIAIGTTSYLLRSSALIMDSAERSETSCSPERPPKMTPTFSFFDKTAPQKNRPQRKRRITKVEKFFVPLCVTLWISPILPGELHDLFPKRRQNQLYTQFCRSIRYVKNRIDLGQFERKHLARIGDLFHC